MIKTSFLFLFFSSQTAKVRTKHSTGGCFIDASTLAETKASKAPHYATQLNAKPNTKLQ